MKTNDQLLLWIIELKNRSVESKTWFGEYMMQEYRNSIRTKTRKQFITDCVAFRSVLLDTNYMATVIQRVGLVLVDIVAEYVPFMDWLSRNTGVPLSD